MEAGEGVDAAGGGLLVVEGAEGGGDGLRRAEQRRQREDHHPVAQLLQLDGGEQRRLAALDHVGEERRVRDRLAHRLQFVERLRRLDEDDVGAGLVVEPPAADRLVQAERGARVGAADDHEVVVFAGVDGRAELLDLLLGGNDALALEVAALLGPLLVLEDDAGDARAHALANGAHHVERVAVAGVHVRDERHVDGSDDGAHAVEHLGRREQAVVRCAEGGGGEPRSPW